MTRETKIGLLVGLAFIVVFAMLLSHSGPSAPPGDMRQLSRAKQPPAPTLINEPVVDSDVLPISTFRDAPDAMPLEETRPASSVILDTPAPAENDSPEFLPRPSILNPEEPPGTEPPSMGIASVQPRDSLESVRVAPAPTELITAAPGMRELQPAATPEPTTLADAVSVTGASALPRVEPKPTALTTPSAPREHIVQKGETVSSILKSEYGTSSPRVAEAFLRANKDRIKNIDMVIEGQKLVIPALPAHLFEPVDSGQIVLDASGRSREVELARIDQLINETRKAPSEAARLADATAGSSRPAAETRRAEREPVVYEVQSGETLSSIAKAHLGSEARWKEIQRLNPKVDPARMRPGTKLRLPSRRPAANAVEAGST